MGRLYDALKEAKRARQDSDRDSDKASLWEAWGIQEIDIPSVQTDPTARVSQLAETADQGTERVVEAESQEDFSAPMAASDAPQNGSLGALTQAALDRKARLIPHATDTSIVDHYRRLRTKILQKREENPFKTLLVTSASPQEGKTVTVLNLALSMSLLPSFRVLVIDGDLRKGSLGTCLGVSSQQAGLSNLVDGSAKLEDVVLKSEAIPMHFIVRGNSRVADAHASQFDVHFRRLAECYDLVIVDSPPVNLLADVQLLAKCCGAVLLVARSFVTSRQAIEKAVQELQPYNVIGTVLNASEVKRPKSYYGYY